MALVVVFTATTATTTAFQIFYGLPSRRVSLCSLTHSFSRSLSCPLAFCLLLHLKSFCYALRGDEEEQRAQQERFLLYFPLTVELFFSVILRPQFFLFIFFISFSLPSLLPAIGDV